MPSVNRQSLESLLKPRLARAVIGLAVLLLLAADARGAASRPEEAARALFMEGKREEACKVLLAAHAQLRDGPRRGVIEERIRAVSRSFLKTDSARLYQAGLNLLAEGKLGAAEDRFSGVLSREPGLFDALVRRGQARWLQSNEDGAWEDFRQAHAMNPFERELRMWMGLVEIRRGARTEGARQVMAALVGGPASMPQETIPPAAKRNSFYRAVHWAALWAMGREELVQKQLEALVRAKPDPSRPPASWIWEHLLATPLSSRSLVFSARQALRSFPERRIETDGPSGIALQWWDPGSLERAIAERAAEAGGTAAPSPEPSKQPMKSAR